MDRQLYGDRHPNVAEDFINLAAIEGKLDEAAANFRREGEIYRKVYDEKHYFGIALSNEAGVYVDKRQHGHAENLFREALHMYSETLPANHQPVGVAQVRLDRTLARQHRYSEAEEETRAGSENLAKQTSPTAEWLQNARQDLIEEYAALQQPEKAAKVRAEMASLAVKAGDTPGGK
jgi:hypothetical protein